MRNTCFRILAATSVIVAATAVAVPSAYAKPAHCNKKTGVCAPPANLKWTSPPSISDGVVGTFASLGVKGRCPDVRPDGSPLQGTRQVGITVLFSFGGGMGDVAPVAADGSWSFEKSFDAGGTRDLSATVVASCLDVTFTGIDIADYRAHKIAVNP